jgi:membrane protein
LVAADNGAALGVWRRTGRGLTLAWRATGRGVVEFYNSKNLTYASSIAYYSLLSVFPFLLIVLTAISRIAVGKAGSERTVVNLVERALPSDFDFLSEQLVQMQQAPIPLTIVGTIITVWASMGVFGAITSAVDHAWGTDRPYNFFKHKLVAFVMMMAAGLLFVSALVLKGAVQISQMSWFASMVDWFPWLPHITGFAGRQAFMPSLILAIGLVYYFVPNTKVRLRDVWFGAILAALLWRLALAGFSWYLGSFARFNVHGQAGAVVAFLVWVYLSAVILLFGVEVTAAYARARMVLDEAEGK